MLAVIRHSLPEPHDRDMKRGVGSEASVRVIHLTAEPAEDLPGPGQLGVGHLNGGRWRCAERNLNTED
jgi:hypothetical protein